MADDARDAVLAQLKPFAGEWEIEVAFQGAPPMGGARTTFEWLPGELLLLQSWQIPVPEAPDGLAVYGYDEQRETLLQHYFDQRGVVRVYEMAIEVGVWKLERTKADFSPLDFSQRFSGKFSEDGNTIAGTWEIAHDHASYEKDFDITYRKLA